MNRRSFSRLAAAPLLDARVVAREEHFGDAEPPIVGRARELRPPGRFFRKAVLGQRRRIPDDARHQPCHSVDEDHRRDLAAAHHIVADRDLARGEPGADAIVDALVSPAHDDQAGLSRELRGKALVEALAPRLHEHDRAWVVRADRLHRFEHRLRLADHAGAAAERHVVDLPVAIVGEVAQVVSVELHLSMLDATTDNPMLEHRAEHGGEDRDDVKSHLRRLPRVFDLDQPVGDDHPSRFEVDLDHRIAGGRDKVLDRAIAADPHVIRGTFEDFRDRAQVLARAGLHRQPHHLVVVETSLAKCAARFVRHLEIPASEQLGHGAVVDAAELHDQTWLAWPAPFDLALTTIEEQRGTLGEPVVEVCQGNHLDSTVSAVGTGDLADADQAGAPPPCSLRSRGPEWPPSDGLARSTNTRLRSRSDATRTRVLTASMLRPALPMKRPTSASASLTLMATVPPPRSNASTSTSSGFSASDRATYSTSAR